MEPIPGGRAAPVHVYVADGSVSFHVVSVARIAEGKIIQLDEYRGDDGPALEWRQKLGNWNCHIESLITILSGGCLNG